MLYYFCTREEQKFGELTHVRDLSPVNYFITGHRSIRRKCAFSTDHRLHRKVRTYVLNIQQLRPAKIIIFDFIIFPRSPSSHFGGLGISFSRQGQRLSTWQRGRPGVYRLFSFYFISTPDQNVSRAIIITIVDSHLSLYSAVVVGSYGLTPAMKLF